MTNRRSFLAQSTVAGLAATAPVAFADAPSIVPATPGEIRLGVASYSFREFSRNLAIKMSKQLNLTYINIKEFHLPYKSTPEELEKGRKQFESAGLKIVGGGTIYFPKEDDADIRFYFDYCKKAGMPLITGAPTHKTLPMLEKFVKEYDIQVAVHNHGPEDKYWPSIRDVLKVARDMDPRIGVCCDIGHEVRAGKDLLESIEMAGPRLLDLHIKDLKSMSDKGSQVPVGDGILPIPGLFKMLKKIGYKGYVNLEYEIDGDSPMLGMARSYSYMRGVLAGLNG